MTDTEITLTAEDCINYEDSCQGPVEYRMSLSGSGVSFPRCDGHWGKRLESERITNERYPEHPPHDWSPLDAGESWYEG